MNAWSTLFSAGIDGDSDARATVSRSASVAASRLMSIVMLPRSHIRSILSPSLEVVTSQSDTVKSTASSSAASSREVSVESNEW